MAAGTWPDVALAAAGSTRTDNKTATTFDREVDAKLWAALMAKSPILDKLARPQIGNFKFEWENDVAPTRLYTLNDGTAPTDIEGSATGAHMVFTSVAGLQAGSLIRNITRATTVGLFGQDEIMEVTDNTSTDCVVVRDVGRQGNLGTGANPGQGSTAHAVNDVYEVIYTPVTEGSGPSVNKYTDVVLAENYANSVDFYLTVTGDQAATRRLVAGDTVDNQFQKNLLNLQNQLEGMFFYGKLNASANAGSAAYVRRTKGFDSWVAVTGGNVDVTTKDVTPEALDALFAEIMYDKTDPSDNFIIACHPVNARKISQFGMDKVISDNNVSKWGRHIDTFKTDLGIESEVIWSLNISKSDLFIIDMGKVSMPQFRAFERAQWNYGDDGVDAWRQRYLGSFGVKVIDGLYSHAKLGYITW